MDKSFYKLAIKSQMKRFLTAMFLDKLMARPSDFVDPDYDRRLAAFKEEKERLKQEQGVVEKKERKKMY